VMVAEFSMPLQKVIPNLNNQNHSGNAKHGPAEWLWNCIDNLDRIARHGERSAFGNGLRHRDQRLSFFHLDRRCRFGRIRPRRDPRGLFLRAQ